MHTIQEIIVGRPENAYVPTLDTASKGPTSYSVWPFYKEMGGKPFPAEVVNRAIDEIEEFCQILKHEGVIVRRPEIVDYGKGFSTPDFDSPAGLYAAMPRLVATLYCMVLK